MNKNQHNKTSKGNVNNKMPIIIGSVLVIAVLFVFLNTQNKSQAASTSNNLEAVSRGDLTIIKSDITEEASFYPYQSNDTYMEIIAVRASDGSVRTALNTCQVCYRSGRGYYEQKDDVLICRNCGNRFTVDQIELIKGGCNPVPITEDLKTEDEEEILIAETALTQYAPMFANWRK
ncbi:DUF2318 domain-containing protein [Cellulosilyticum sp. I15G10I2]|uniref:DUF2318 domain-containing protein n=1 Tax=Cellulosilyticum sp. I15G10I2 TaxID=1892843 RepID=UPI00085C3073|nr:DUF2318 domain-containing protein [Cellulosilyticum sp. I15G10I2]